MRWLKEKMQQLFIKELQHLDHTKERINKLLSSGLGVHLPPATARSMVPRPAPYGGDHSPAPYKAPYGDLEAEAPRQAGESWQPYIFDTGVGNRKGNIH